MLPKSQHLKTRIKIRKCVTDKRVILAVSKGFGNLLPKSEHLETRIKIRNMLQKKEQYDSK